MPALRQVAPVARYLQLGHCLRLFLCCCCIPSFKCLVRRLSVCVCVWWCKVITLSARLCADFCPNAEMRQIGFNVPDPLFLLVYMLLFCVVMTTFL